MSQKFGKYRMRDALNEGGMTEIWLATNEHEQVVALRRLRPRPKSSASKLFKNGLRVLRKLPPHPHIIGYRTHGRAQGTPYMVLDYINGGNLKQLTLRQDSVIEENVSDVLIGIADALEHMHDHGWMHLDLKPENVMVDLRAHAYLLDFDTAGRPVINGQVIVFCTEQLVLFHPTESKHGAHIEAFLTIEADGQSRPWQGTATADAVNIHDQIFAVAGRTESGCNAHGLRA